MEAAIDAYRWLRAEEGSPLIGGDSAGGGLTLQALIAMRDRGDPLPPAAILLSPVTDWIRFEGESYRTRRRVDPLITPEMCRLSAAWYIGDGDPDHPLLSPTRMDLSGLPPLCVHVGDCEVMLSDSLALARKVPVDLHVWPGMWHVFQAAARLVPEGRRSLEEIGRFVEKHRP
jgi:acetyl esterase/lipase